MRISDWSSDVCSSDLLACKELDWALENGARMVSIRPAPVPGYRGSRSLGNPEFDPFWARVNESGIFVVLHVSDSGYDEIYRWRSEERRGGKEGVSTCTSRWWPFT